jgi:hypothetical protein
MNEQLLFESLFLLDQSSYDGTKGNGRLIEIKSTYDLSTSLKLTAALTHITGNSKLDDAYTFNNMEDFSHIRFELKYFF